VHPRKDAFIHAMPAYLADTDVVALKWVSGYPANKARGLPYISGLVVLNDAETGLPLAVMDGAEITAARTAAASGVCVRRWAPDGWRRAAILGCGEQGRYHVGLLRELNPQVVVAAYDPHPDRVRELEGQVEEAGSELEAVAGAEVVVTAAPIVQSPHPPVGVEALDEPWLVLPIDFDALVRRDVVESADLFVVDDVEQFDYYREQGHFRDWPRPAGSVGEALGRTGSPAKVACVNLGIGALDAAFAARVLTAAHEQGVGTRLRR
jgi:ornithine cyclodeaminase/alanine dehydrogenase-like protein (mu-crystallin family)